MQARHGELFRAMLPERRPLPGAVELLGDLRDAGVIHGVATSGSAMLVLAVANHPGVAGLSRVDVQE